MELYVIVVDFAKAFDTVSRKALQSALNKFSFAMKVTNKIKALHVGMQTKAVEGKDTSNEFAVTSSVKQGLVLAPSPCSHYILQLCWKLVYVHEGIRLISSPSLLLPSI